MTNSAAQTMVLRLFAGSKSRAHTEFALAFVMFALNACGPGAVIKTSTFTWGVLLLMRAIWFRFGETGIRLDRGVGRTFKWLKLFVEINYKSWPLGPTGCVLVLPEYNAWGRYSYFVILVNDDFEKQPVLRFSDQASAQVAAGKLNAFLNWRTFEMQSEVPKFQFHLSTVVATSFCTGLCLWANLAFQETFQNPFLSILFSIFILLSLIHVLEQRIRIAEASAKVVSMNLQNSESAEK